MYVEGPGRWRRIRVRDVERQSIGEEARCTEQAKLASGERLGIFSRLENPHPQKVMVARWNPSLSSRYLS